MARSVLLPCVCGAIHRIPDPGTAVHLRCAISGTSLLYEAHAPDGYCLRGRIGDILLDEETIEIGRNVRVSVNHPTLSRRHCCLLRTGEGYSILDFGSSNGTFVNEESVDDKTPVPLEGGDLVRLGDLFFRYLVPAPTAAIPLDPAFAAANLKEEGLTLAAADDGDRLVGRVLGGYKLVSVMNEGGMGRLYHAVEETTGRACVVKTIHSQEQTKEEAVTRFIGEMDFSLRIRHPNIVECFTAGQVGHALYLVMEHLPGKNLRQWYEKRQASTEAAILIAKQVASALKTAHDEGVIHRDIKPENIIMNAKAQVKVVDFGIAKLRGEGDATRITVSGAVVGTLRFLSPEQVAGRRDFGPGVDIYALGAVLYFCLTGRAPYQERNLLQLQKAMKVGALPPSHFRSGILPELETLIMRCLATNPYARYATMDELIQDLTVLPGHV